MKSLCKSKHLVMISKSNQYFQNFTAFLYFLCLLVISQNLCLTLGVSWILRHQCVSVFIWKNKSNMKREVLIEKPICVTNPRNRTLAGAWLFRKDVKHCLMLPHVGFRKLLGNISLDSEGEFLFKWPCPLRILFGLNNYLFLQVSTFATYQLGKMHFKHIFILVTTKMWNNIYSSDLFLNISWLFYSLLYKIIRTINF